jgi:hypothetical protein
VKVISILAVFCLAVPIVRAEPCEASSVMRRGSVAACEGVLVPGTRAAQCVADAEDLAGCRIRLDAEVKARAIADAAHEEERTTFLAALEAERQAARSAAVPELRTDWSAFGWGVGFGVLVGVAGAVAVAYAVR